MTRFCLRWALVRLNTGILRITMLICCLILLSGCRTNRSVTTLWEQVEVEEVMANTKSLLPDKYTLFKFDVDLLKEALEDVGSDEANAIIVQLPDPGVNTGPFKICRSSIVSEKLLKKFPSLASYKGFRTSDVAAKIRLETPPPGLQVMVTETGKTWYIAPYNAEEDVYMLFEKTDLNSPNKFWEGKN